MRAPSLSRLLQMSQERDDLYRLAEPHLISQDTGHSLLVQHCQPVQTY